MKSKKPKLSDYKGDVSKRWAVYYYENGERKRIWISLKLDKKERYLEAAKIIAGLNSSNQLTFSQPTIDFTPPEIRDYNGDLTKRWAVYYYENAKRKIIWISERLKTKAERYEEGNRIKLDIIARLSNVNLEDNSSDLKRKIKSQTNEIAFLKRQLTMATNQNKEIQIDHRTKVLVDQIKNYSGVQVIENVNFNQIVFQVNNVNNNNVTINSNPNKKLLTEAINEALEFKKSFVAVRTYYDYKQVLNKLLKWINKNHPGIGYDEFTSYMANQFIEQTYTRRKYTAKTVNVNTGYIYTIFKRISEVYPMDTNPFKIQSLRENEPEINLWETLEKAKLFEHLKKDEPEMFLIVLMVYQCFLRPNEIRQIQIKDINLHRSTIKVSSLKGKSNKGKYATMSKQLKGLLTPIVESNPPQNYIFSGGLKPGKYPLSRNTISYRFNVIRGKLKLSEDLKMYNFKHTGNSELLEKGLNIRELQLQNGHSDIKITEQYLRRVNNIGNSKIIDAWEEV